MPRVVGIDLGTTNSLVAVVDGGLPRVLKPEGGAALVPSIVASRRDGTLAAGDEARALMLERPADAVYSVKRLMGREIRDVQHLLPRLPYRVMGDAGDILRVKVGYAWLTPPQVSAEILRALRVRAQDALQSIVSQAVITVPAYFNDGQRQATRDAGKLAGLDVLRIVNEPTAACLAYGLQERREGNVAVYDLGGGTFDISILRLEGGVFEVLATNGDTELGGDDLDRLLAEHFLERLRAQDRAAELNPHLLQLLRLEAERAKCALSSEDTTTVRLVPDDGGAALEFPYTREEFEALIRPLIARTLEPCRQALEDSGLLQEEISEVVMVGGSTRIPLVRRMIGEYFECTPHTELNPEEVVALGAAVQADILAGNTRSLLLLDVTPLSLGMEAYGGVVQRIIPRNTTIPASVTELFTNFVDSQTHVEIHVLQGERELAADNRSLAKFRLGPLPPLAAGMHRIEVTFTLDADGVLSVRALDQRTKAEQAIQIKPTYGLTDAEVEAMLLTAEAQSPEDHQRRMMIEEKQHAEMTVRATAKAIAEAGDLIDEVDLIVIEEQLGRLKKAMAGDSVLELRAGRDRLEAATQPLALAMMNAALTRGLRGRRASEVLGHGGETPALDPKTVNPTHQRTVSAGLKIDSGGGTHE